MDSLLMCADAFPTFLGFFEPSFAPPLLYYAYIPISIVAIILGLFVLLNKNERLQSLVFFLLTVTFVLQLLNEIVLWTATPAGLVAFSWSMVLLLRFSFLVLLVYFAYLFINGKKGLASVNFASFLILLPVVLLLPTALTLQGVDISACEGVDGPLWLYSYFIESLVLIGFIFTSFKYHRKYRIDKASQTLQVTYLSIGITVLLVYFSLTEILGEYSGFYEVTLLGPVGMLVFLAMIAFLIVKFNAFKIKLAAAQALVVSILLVNAAQLFYVESIIKTLIVLVTIALTGIGGYLLVRSVKQEVAAKERNEALARDLARVNDRLRDLDRQKSEFVSIASHQLRSPLTAIRGYASMILEGSFGKLPTKAQEAIERIHESAGFMALSIEDFLNVSRIEQGRMKYEFTDMDLKSMVEKIVDEIRPSAIKKGLVLMFKSRCEGKCIVHVDPGKMRQIIYNLIDNSLKYTQKGTVNVTVSDNVKGKRLYVEIKDTGVGMSTETLHNIFDKFVRAKNANSVNVSGTGLGLYVAKQMIEAMGGKVTPASEGEGKGSAFTIELPLA